MKFDPNLFPTYSIKTNFTRSDLCVGKCKWSNLRINLTTIIYRYLEILPALEFAIKIPI